MRATAIVLLLCTVIQLGHSTGGTGGGGGGGGGGGHNETECDLQNDPRLTTFNSESVNFPYPCRFKLTHVTTKLTNKRSQLRGACDIIGFGFNGQSMGKFVSDGFQIAIRVLYNSGRVVERSAQVFGTAANGIYSYDIQGTETFTPNGPYESESISYNDRGNGISVSLSTINNGQEVLFEAKGCGFSIKFVAYDTVLKRAQPLTPGLSVRIRRSHMPVFQSQDKVMCLGEVGFPGGEYLNSTLRPGLTQEQSFLCRAFLIDIPQTQPSANPECAVGHQILSSCEEQNKTNAIIACSWMLAGPASRFINCMGADLLKTFNLCTAHFCEGRPCQDAITAIQDENCDQVPDIPGLPGFINGDSCQS